ncbi:aminoglycoside adenylyltransferase domain-containing protein [Neobacillus sp. SCS-31]|uniref:aminoglycoside adenylyltransferase domain-containing protein n=1 Tax=Neobacillus oceani TaxID=3115292 RepID=UPI003906C4FD
MKREPELVFKVCETYIDLWHKHLPGKLEGFYLHGSIVLGAFEDHSSDLDFVAVTKNPLEEEELQIVKKIHKAIAASYPKPEMDGMYIVWEDFGRRDTFNNAPYPSYNEGQLSFEDRFNPVTWWLLKRKGISLLGPNNSELDIRVTEKDLVEYVLDNMDSYWGKRVEWLEKSKEKLSAFSTAEISGEIEWTVLGLLRQFYTLNEFDIVSKLGAGEYGLAQLPEEWHPIIREAIAIRSGNGEALFGSNEDRIDRLLEFAEYIIGSKKRGDLHEEFK